MKKEKQSTATSIKTNLRNRSASDKKSAVISRHTNQPNMVNGTTTVSSNGSSAATSPLLTAFEVTIMQHISNGAENNQLAKDYNTTTHAIEWHRKQLMKKLGANHITEAVAIGLRKKIIS